jgi:hypothetical protein
VGVPVTGSKDELVARLVAAGQEEGDEEDEELELEEEGEDGGRAAAGADVRWALGQEARGLGGSRSCTVPAAPAVP